MYEADHLTAAVRDPRVPRHAITTSINISSDDVSATCSTTPSDDHPSTLTTRAQATRAEAERRSDLARAYDDLWKELDMEKKIEGMEPNHMLACRQRVWNMAWNQLFNKQKCWDAVDASMEGAHNSSYRR
jgi:hypothetical protein